jgi:hypothetical protein
MYDLVAREWRHRELFSPPLDVSLLWPADPLKDEVRRLLAGEVGALYVRLEEDRRLRRHVDPATGEAVERELGRRQWRIEGRYGEVHVEILVDPPERFLDGKCGCAFFQESRLSRGPCAHMRALLQHSRAAREASSA